MNKERLEEVAQWLEAGAPERKFNMGRLLDEETGSVDNNWCGTECCIAGYVVTRYIPQEVDFDKVEEDATELLGLEESVSDALFYPKVLGSLESLGGWNSETGGWENITPAQAAQDALFYPRVLGSLESLGGWNSETGGWENITPAQAAQAVRNVMEHNNPLWEEILE